MNKELLNGYCWNIDGTCEPDEKCNCEKAKLKE